MRNRLRRIFHPLGLLRGAVLHRESFYVLVIIWYQIKLGEYSHNSLFYFGCLAWLVILLGGINIRWLQTCARRRVVEAASSATTLHIECPANINAYALALQIKAEQQRMIEGGWHD